jgi:hypothetical protein
MRPTLGRLLLLVLLTMPLEQGCDLSTAAPTGVVLPGGLDGPHGLPTRLAGAIGDFAVAYGGNNPEDGFILVSGLLADELRQTVGTSFNVDVDQRSALISNALTESVYRDLQRARTSAEKATDAYDSLNATAVGGLYARNLAGFTYVLLAEGFCGAVPFSRVAPDGTVIYGGAETTPQVLERAVAEFDSALAVVPSVAAAHSASSDSVAAQANLARVGRARALLDLGRFADAGAEAARVPDDFRWKLEYSGNSPREVNGLNFHIGLDYNPADSEGVNGIAFLAAGDPRAQVDTVQAGLYYAPVEYGSAAAPIVLADSREARLIQAEALLRAGDASGSLAVLNSLRASIGLPPLAEPGSLDGRVTQLFRERAFWLWLTGHRLGDLRRLVRQYGRSSDTVYPTGPYAGGPGPYGNQLDLPVYEVNNPRYDPSACDPSQP